MKENVHFLKELVKKGCLIQINSSSLLKESGKTAYKWSVKLIKENFAHFIASDSHDSKRRKPNLKNAYDLVTKKFSESTSKRLFIENPQKVLENKKII